MSTQKKGFFEKGDLLLINSRAPHTIDSVGEGLNGYIMLQFAPELIYSTDQSISEMKYILPFILNTSNQNSVIYSKDLNDSCVPDIMSKMLDESQKHKYGFELAIKINICQLCLWILRYWNSHGLNIGEDIDVGNYCFPADQISRVFRYVDKNYSSDITVTQMAEYCHMSYSYFSRSFKALTGQNFTEYLNYVRLREAERMLSTTEESITDIAYETGFSSTSYFVSKFKEHRGITPKKFRDIVADMNSDISDTSAS